MHARELPQRDDLCGAFCGALALRAAGIEERDGEPLDQDAVALAAGSVDLGSARGRARFRMANADGATTGSRCRRSRTPTSRGRPRQDCSTRSRSCSARRARARSPTPGPGARARSPACSSSPPRSEHPVTLVANFATRHLWGGHPSVEPAARLPASTASCAGPRTGLGRRALRVRRRARARAARQPVLPSPTPTPRSATAACTCSRGAPGGGARAPRHARRRHDRGRARAQDAARVRAGARRARAARGRVGQRHREPSRRRVSAAELVALVCCDLGAIVRGRSVLGRRARRAPARGRRLGARQPRAHAARAGRRAQPVRLDRRPAPAARRRHARARARADGEAGALELLLCDIVETDGRPWECCPRGFLREALGALERELGARVRRELRARVPAARRSERGPAPSNRGITALEPELRSAGSAITAGAAVHARRAAPRRALPRSA